ncbi:MAG: CarD family transcriptional regulator [Spirochaetia bacterium]
MKKATTSRAPTKYKHKQQVVYPLQGVGQIISIEKRLFKDEKLLYYIIYLEVTDMTVMVPVDKADELGIRAIVSKKKSDEALTLISEEFEPIPADWKLRYQMNLDLLKQGSIKDIATVVRALYHRSKVKELPILERKLFDSALRLLVDEVSFSLNKSKDDVEELIFNKLEAEPKKPVKKSAKKPAAGPGG